MESSESGPVDDNKNLEDEKQEECESEVLPSQNEEDLSGEQIIAYVIGRPEDTGVDSENALYLDHQGLSINGQRLLLTNEGNEIILLVQDDPDGQPGDETFVQTSILHSDEDGLKEHGMLVDENSQGFIIKTDASDEHEERQIYIENGCEILNISNENQDSPVDSLKVESPLWSVAGNGQSKDDSTETLFVSNPLVVVPPEEVKHQKLMQLARIAHEIQSADQKSSSAFTGECAKDTEPSCEFENSAITLKREKDSSTVLVLSPDEISDKCLPSEESEKFMHSKSADVSSLLSSTLIRTVDNTVSVIHSTTTEIQENLENQDKRSSPPDFASEKNFQNSENELPSEMLYSNISSVAFHNNLNESKQIEECARDDLEENGQLLILDDNAERSHVPDSDLGLGDDDSPMTFIEKSQKLDADALISIEDSPSIDADSEMRVDDDSHAESPMLVEESKDHEGGESSVVLTGNPLAEDTVVEQRSPSKESEVSNEANSEFIVLEDDISNNASATDASATDNDLPLIATKFNKYSYKLKARKLSPERSPILSPVIPEDKTHSNSCQSDTNESSLKLLQSDNTEINESNKNDNVDFENSPSDLIIAENIDGEESNADVADTADLNQNKSENVYDFDSESNNVDADNNKEFVSADKLYATSGLNIESVAITDAQSVSVKESNVKSSIDNLIPETVTKDDDEFSSNEETLVKPPKKTYIRKKIKKYVIENKSNGREKIELFSGEDFNFTECDKEINDVETCLNSDSIKECASSQVSFESDDHLAASNVQSNVFAKYTYNRKRKSAPIKKGLRLHSLRPRLLSSSLPLRNGSSEISDNDSKRNCFSSDIPWADVLLKTPFQPCDVVHNDTPSTSFASQHPKETSTPLLSPEQQRRKVNKCKRDFDRLLNSPPATSRQTKVSRKHIPKGRKKIIEAGTSTYWNFQKSKHFKSLPMTLLKRPAKKRMYVGSQKLKEAKIRFLESPKTSLEQASQNKREMYSCSSCNFSSVYVDNLMEHLKYCSNRQPMLDYKVNDMDKRQRIRGEEISNTVKTTLQKIRNDLRNALMDDDSSLSFTNQYGEDERDSDNLKKRKKYGYGEDDVVWVKFKDRFWPALVCDIKGLTTYVKLISYPEEEKCLKVKHENIRTFDDSKWNLLCLAEAESLPHNEIFVKAVQSCERFISKKFLGFHVTGKAFFSVRDEVDFATDSASSDCIVNEDSDSEDLEMTSAPARKARYEKLDIQKIHEHILGGKADDYVLDIYYERKHSKKHLTFFKNNDDLKHRPWFGPCEDAKQQEDLFRHFRDLFMGKIGKKGFFVSYICQVWIPEAIVQAISIVQGIPLEDAEILFESEDSLDLEHEDPSVDEILKKYS